MSSDVARSFGSQGYVLVPGLVCAENVESLVRDIEKAFLDSGRKHRAGQTFGIRNLLDAVSSTRALAEGDLLASLIKILTGQDMHVVRGIYFDKPPLANWKVAWHQDVTIAVRNRKDVSGFQGWSLKAGIHHVQAPASVLEQIVTVRVHLDDSNESNGALRVIPGSHAQGEMSPRDVEWWKGHVSSVTCEVPKGGVLVMRPLLLHASSKSKSSQRRRVLHFEHACGELPGGLKWNGW